MRTRNPAALGRGLKSVVALVALFALAQPDLWARGGFKGGGFRSSSGTRSTSSSRSSSFKSSGGTRSTTSSRSITLPSMKGWGSATKPSASGAAASTSAASSASGSGSSSSRLTTSGSSLGRSTYQNQKSVYDSARRNGTLFSTKADAQDAFKSRYKDQYASTFKSEPASRPAYIPSYTTVGGRNVNIVYNAGLGGYGYMDPFLGRWILYDALADAVMVDTLMHRHDYYYGPPVYASHSSGFLSFALFLLFAVIIVMVVSSMLRRARWR